MHLKKPYLKTKKSNYEEKDNNLMEREGFENNEEKEILWIGNEYFIGIEKFFKKIKRKNYKIQNRVILSRYRGKTLCNICNGSRLRRETYYVKIDNKNLPDILKMSISELEVFFKTIKLNKIDSEISNRIIKEIKIQSLTK